jgi:hypothetical protein
MASLEETARKLWYRGGQDRWLSGSALALAIAILGWTLQQTNGTLRFDTIRTVTAVLVLTVIAVLAPKVRWIERFNDGPIILIVAVTMAYQLSIQFTVPPGIYLRGGDGVAHHELAAYAALACGMALAVKPALNWLTVPLMLAAHFGLGVWLIKASPAPHIDVWYFHKGAFEALAQGISPWTITYPNIYGHTIYYGEGFADAQRVLAGFPYPPLQLLHAWVADKLGGDYRYGHLFFMTLSGALLSYARPGRLGPAAAMLLIFTPRSMFVIEQGWTEPVVVCLLAAVLFAACRFPKVLPWTLGLFFAIKQYAPIMAPLALLQLGGPELKPRLRILGKAIALAAVITVPFFLWEPNGFLRAVLIWQTKQPFRMDALSYISATAKDGVPVLPLWLNIAVLPVAWAIAAWRAPRTPAGLGAASALLFLFFVAFAKQAFCNYYFLVLGCLCCALAMLQPEDGKAPPGTGRAVW